jgi:putative NADH-flavin reductase
MVTPHFPVHWDGSCVKDYAVAVLDELERPKHERQRFTVTY